MTTTATADCPVPRCRWHPRRKARVIGLESRLGYCAECWPPEKELPPRLIRPFDATLWLAS